jgi:adenylate cyclase
MKNYTVEFNYDHRVEISEGQSLLDASLSAGIPHIHVCGGNAKCSTCRVLVLEGAEFLSSPNEKEQRLNDQMHFPPNVRLACQTSVIGEPVKLRRMIRDESDIDLYVGKVGGEITQGIGEERELVLFFLDIRDFTGFLESHLAFDVIHIIRKLFSKFQTIVESNNGKILETTGDGFYSVFSCEGGKPANVQSAIQSGFSILKELELLNGTYFKPHFDHIFQVGIGIHIGKVISGEIKMGSEEHLFVMGLPVNIASRLQNATKEYNNSFIVSAEAYNYFSDQSQGHESISISLKGITDEIKVFLLGKAYQ